MKLLISNYKKKNIYKKEIAYIIKNITKKFKKKTKIIIKFNNIEKIKKFNLIYRGINKYTNILSFKNYNINEKEYIGDLIICNELIKFNKTINKIILINLIIHGTLHLLNLNHNKIYEKKQMEILEIEILKNLNYNNPYYLSK
ncbi:MAG: rRNA maturation RNase YbeY [Enterobacteriaceae bacterium]